MTSGTSYCVSNRQFVGKSGRRHHRVSDRDSTGHAGYCGPGVPVSLAEGVGWKFWDGGPGDRQMERSIVLPVGLHCSAPASIQSPNSVRTGLGNAETHPISRWVRANIVGPTIGTLHREVTTEGCRGIQWVHRGGFVGAPDADSLEHAGYWLFKKKESSMVNLSRRQVPNYLVGPEGPAFLGLRFQCRAICGAAATHNSVLRG